MPFRATFPCMSPPFRHALPTMASWRSSGAAVKRPSSAEQTRRLGCLLGHGSRLLRAARRRRRMAHGTMSADPRSPTQRRRDTEHRLANDVDVWVASASADGAPYLVQLSFDWDGEAVLVATPTDSPTGRNLAATRAVRKPDQREPLLVRKGFRMLELEFVAGFGRSSPKGEVVA